MTFIVGDTNVILKGDPSLTRVEISLKVLVKMWQSDDQEFLVDFRAMGISKTNRMLSHSSWQSDDQLNNSKMNSKKYLCVSVYCWVDSLQVRDNLPEN